MTKTDCPTMNALQSLLDEVDAQDGEEILGHLEGCTECRHSLETLAGDATAWRFTAAGLGQTTRYEPALRQIVERLKDEDLLGAVDDDLSFLQSTDKPDVLGLLGDYEVQERIGRGGMGIVLKATDPSLSRTVAIKVLSPKLATSATARRRFVREGRAAAKVVHDHIVTVHSVQETDGLSYLIMQHVEGESLQERLDREGPLELMEIVRIAQQAAAGLAAAHAQGLIHRDIKPANLLLEVPRLIAAGTPEIEARVRITDFGLARMVDDVQMTQHGMVIGTPEYMAPEQARGEAVDHRADLFSLGSVLYAMCTGRPPFRASSTVAVLRQVSDDTPMLVRSINPDIPDWLTEIVERLMRKNPDERFQSASEVAKLLAGFLAQQREPHLPASVVSAMPSRHKRRAPGRSVVLLAIAILLILVPVSLWHLLSTAAMQEDPAKQPGGAVADGKKDKPAVDGKKETMPAAKLEMKPGVAPGEQATRSYRGLSTAGVAAVLIALSLAGVFLAFRQRQKGEKTPPERSQTKTSSAAAPVPFTLQCPTCQRKLRAKAEQAGKKVKCPGCGSAVAVPSLQAGLPPQDNPSKSNEPLPTFKPKHWLGLVALAAAVALIYVGLATLWAHVQQDDEAQIEKERIALNALEKYGPKTELEGGHVVLLHLSGPNVGDEVMEHVVCFPQLRSLGLYRTSVSDAGIAKLAVLKQVEDLNIGGSRVTNQGLASLQKVTSLQRVWLRTNDRLTKAGISAFTDALPGVVVDDEALRIRDSDAAPIDNTEKLALQALETLRPKTKTDDGHVVLLHLHGPKVDDRAMDQVARFPLLRTLSLWRASVTDKGIAKLAGLTHIEDLNIIGTSVSNDGLATLQKVTSLRRVWLRTNGRLTKTGVDSFAKASPWVTVDDEAVRIPDSSATPIGKERREYRQTFQGLTEIPKDLAFFGPNADARVKFEPEGMRIQLPPGHTKRADTGVVTRFGVEGDFEITLKYEFLQEPDLKDAGPQTRFTLFLSLDNPKPYWASINHHWTGGPPEFLTWMWAPGPTGQPQRTVNFVPVQAKLGQLRLTRSGPELSYFAAEGAGDFKFLQKYTFAADNVNNVRISAATGGPKASVDVRVTDFVIRAGPFPNPAPVDKVAPTKNTN